MKRALCLFVLCLAAVAHGEVPAEVPGAVETLGSPQPHWVWVSDLILERSALVDADSGKFLGQINGGYGAIAPLFPKSRSEAYLTTTYFARRTHGDRTDLLEIYDLKTLGLSAEVKVPGKRAIDAVALAHSALSDDDRFAAIFNWTPRTSLSIVDTVAREFVAEIEIPGCGLVYAAGPRRFFSLCADGSALVVTLDERGRELRKERTKPFIDPKADPVTEKAVRYGNLWLFVSFDGWVHAVDVSGEQLVFAERWSLFSQSERDSLWRIGGWQHLAIHQPSGRLYSLVHRGKKDTHKEPGEEVWVYDIASRQRIQRVALRVPGLTVMGFPIEAQPDWPAPAASLLSWLIDTWVPPLVSHIQVTQDEKPLLITAAQFSGALGIYDARSGRWLHRVPATGWTTDLLLAPFGNR